MTAPKPDSALPWPLPYESVDLICEFEGLRLVAYQCGAGVWTIGWGETDGVRPGDRCTKEQADRWHGTSSRVTIERVDHKEAENLPAGVMARSTPWRIYPVHGSRIHLYTDHQCGNRVVRARVVDMGVK